MLPQINSQLNIGQTSFRGESPFLQRIKHIEPRGKPIVPLEINIKCNEGLLQEDHQRLTQLVTRFEQRRLKSLIREPSDNEETGFYTKIQGYQTKPKIYSKRNYDFLAQTLKHNKSLKQMAYSIELDQDGNQTHTIEQQVLTTQTESLRPVTNIREKEKLQTMISQSKFIMTPLEIKQLKDTIRLSQNSSSLLNLMDKESFNQQQSPKTQVGFFTSRRKLSTKPQLIKSKSSAQVPKLSPRLRDLYQSNQQELKQILMNKLNSSSVRDLQMTQLISEASQNPDGAQVDQNHKQESNQANNFTEINELDEYLEETKSNIHHQDQKDGSPNNLINSILHPTKSVLSFNIDAINDKIYFQRVDKDQSHPNSTKVRESLESPLRNLTSQGFIQDYDRPSNANMKYQLGNQTIIGLPENTADLVNQLVLRKSQTKKDEIKNKDFQLQIMLKPKYTGSVDHQINTLAEDFLEQQLDQRKKEEAKKFIGGRKIKIKINLEPEVNNTQKDLIDEYSNIKDEKSQNRVLEGLWMNYDTDGQFPSTREGSGCVAIDNKIYMMFGFQNKLMDDIRALDIKTMKWENLQSSIRGNKPDKRFNFSIGKYKNSIVIFGGASNYLSRIKQRETFNDIWLFNPNSEELLAKQSNWTQLPQLENVPSRSMLHSGCVFGCTFVIYGGMTKEKDILESFMIYDLEALTWIKCAQSNKTQQQIGPKFMHTLTSVMVERPQKQQMLYNQEYDIDLISKSMLETKTTSFLTGVSQYSVFTRQQWAIQPKHDKFGISGMYLFGGMDDKGNVSNDLWLIKPAYSKNLDNLMPDTCEFRENFEKKLFYDLSLVQTQGKPPLPRYQHQTVFFQNKYLLIHGGRNNREAYGLTRNVALNDMALLDLERKSWCIISMLGEIPTSRWNHSMVNIDNDKIFIFGGKNLLSFCSANVICFHTDKKKIGKEIARLQQENEDNKNEMKKYKFI